MKNQLSSEKSPYLQQHKHNPVWWQAWGEEAFLKAQQQNRLVFLSIGYSTCHWCHVMEHESFECESVARVLNDNFVCIKVDREELPAVDDLYMTAVQQMTGRGGWPLSVFLTPKGHPFFGGTYFPKPQFLDVCQRIQQVWQSDPGRILEDGLALVQAQKNFLSQSETESEKTKWRASLEKFCATQRQGFDQKYGGFGAAPKFPPSMHLLAMMRFDELERNQQHQDIVKITLSRMAQGGLFDHLAGGFHRYSVDEKWLVPHFEKMLYDNAWLAQVYFEASVQYQSRDFERVGQRVLNYVLAEMVDKEGGFYAAQDADSWSEVDREMREGYFCTWSFDELNDHLSSQQLDFLKKAYGVSESGNFEGRNILYIENKLMVDSIDKEIHRSTWAVLKNLRAQKPQPLTDRKIIASWNGWMISAFCTGYSVTGAEKYLHAAQKAMDHLMQQMWVGEQLYRRRIDGEIKFKALAEDYVSVIAAGLDLYQVCWDEKYLNFSLQLQDQLDDLFWDEDGGGYFSAETDDLLFVRIKEDYDGVRPNANTQGVKNLLLFYDLTGELNFMARAERIFEGQVPRLQKYPGSLPYLAVSLVSYFSDALTLIFTDLSSDSQQVLDYLKTYNSFEVQLAHVAQSQSVRANFPVLDKKQNGKEKGQMFLCHRGFCEEPVRAAEAMIDKIKTVRNQSASN